MNFLGLDLSKVPSQNFKDPTVYIIPVLYVVTSFISIKITNASQNKLTKKNAKEGEEKTAEDEAMESMQAMNNSMTYMVPIMSISIAFIAPLGLALYWLISNVLIIVERMVINKIFEEKDEEEECKNV